MVASHQSNSFMKLEIGFWCNAMPVTSILENKSYSVRKMDLGRIECLPASVIEIEKWKILSTISQLLYDNFSIQNGNFDEKINVLLLLTEKVSKFQNTLFSELPCFPRWQVQIGLKVLKKSLATASFIQKGVNYSC